MRTAFVAFVALMLGQSPSGANQQSDAVGGWTRVAPADGSYFVEVPCSSDRVTQVPPPQVRRAAGDDRVTVTCEANDVVFYASRVSVASDVELPRPLFDLMRESVTSAEIGANMSFADLAISERRVLRSRETTAEGLVGQTDIVEIDDRSAMLLVARTPNRIPPPQFEDQVSQFVASFEVVP